MTIISQSGNTTDITLNGTTPVAGTVNKPAAVPSPIYSILNMDPSQVVFVRFGFGVAATPASAVDLPIPPGVLVGVEPGAGVTTVSVVCSGASTAHVYITPCYAGARF